MNLVNDEYLSSFTRVVAIPGRAASILFRLVALIFLFITSSGGRAVVTSIGSFGIIKYAYRSGLLIFNFAIASSHLGSEQIHVVPPPYSSLPTPRKVFFLFFFTGSGSDMLHRINVNCTVIHKCHNCPRYYIQKRMVRQFLFVFGR